MATEEEPQDMDTVLDRLTDEDNGAHLTSKTLSHFYHERVILDEINILASFNLVGPSPIDNRQRWAIRISLMRYFSLYQYQSYLLDPYLEKMITPLITPIRKVVRDLTIGDHQDKSLNEMGNEVFYMLYFITMTRGYKTVLKFFPHEVEDLEPAFAFLKAQNDRSKRPWETRYVLLLWLSLMCMIPFDLKSIDSAASKSSERIPLVDDMVEAGKTFLDCAGKDRDGAALFLARLLTRKDTCTLYLTEFVEWCKKVLTLEPSIFQVIGILATLCWIFKLGQREVLLPIAEGLEEMLTFIEAKHQFMMNSTVKKLIIKLSQRVGLCLLKPRVAAWRYQRGNRSLLSNLNAVAVQGSSSNINKVSTTITEESEDDENFDVPEAIENVIERLMNGLRDRDTIVRWSAAKGMGRISNRLPKDMADDVVGGIFELFSEDVFQLPNGEPDVSSVSEHTWHGACLAIAELSRRGLLLPHRLTELIPWIILALKFDVKRGAHSVGSNVRDSSCYVCWSFARAYTPEVLDEHVRRLSNTLVAVSVFDRDINIRRASSAAFQENVGRMGIFPHGIDIVTVADFMSVGQINNSFLTVAPYIAGFPEYRRNLTQHLLETVITHWDIAVREVASEAMARIAVLDLDYACGEIIPSLTKMTSSLDSTIRHGALIALGRTCKAVKAHSELPLEQRLSVETLQGIAQVVPTIPEFTLSGFGSEHIRQALCVYITNLSEAGWAVEEPVLKSWKAIVDSTLDRIEEPLQKLASETFKALVAQYGISEAEITHAMSKVAPGAERFGQRGYALALGEIDYKVPLNAKWIGMVVEALAKNANPNLVNEAVADAESRRNSLFAVTNIVGVLDDSYRNVVSKDVSRQILEVYYTGLQDYSIDHRGDVGSWSREASMQGLQTLLPLIARLDLRVLTEDRYLSDEDHAQVLAKLLQQSVEKIDRIRACAANAIIKILYAKAPSTAEYLLRIPHREKVMSVFEDSVLLDWNQAAQVYPRVVQLLNLKEYRMDLLLGFIVSAGGLTESLVRHASACLAEFIADLPITNMDEDGSSSSSTVTLVEFGNEIMNIVENYEGQERIIVPLLEVLDMLVESGALLMMEDDYDFAPMVRFVRRQTLKCKDTRKLCASVRLFCGLCGLGGKIKNAILLELLRLLVHPFPKIRRQTADSMYLMLSGSVEEPTPESEQVGQILMNSD
ncbi:hypothetical protein BGZ83_011058, partial [Gryganskiella cystojenkinii]